MIVTTDEDVSLRLSSEDGFLYEDYIVSGDTARFEVPRKSLSYSFFSDCGAFFDGLGCFIPYGSEAPPIREMCGNIVAAGESVRLPVQLRKSYSLFTLDVHTLALASTSPVPSVTVSGNVCGWLWSGEPRPGPFSVETVPEDGVFSVCIPRPVDSSLLLTVSLAGADRTFALGELLARDGYDWSAPDLEDVSIYIDYAATILDLSITRYPSVVYQDAVVY